MMRGLARLICVGFAAYGCRQGSVHHESGPSQIGVREAPKDLDRQPKSEMDLHLAFLQKRDAPTLHVTLRNTSGHALWANSVLSLSNFEGQPALGNLFVLIRDRGGKRVASRCLIDPRRPKQSDFRSFAAGEEVDTNIELRPCFPLESGRMYYIEAVYYSTNAWAPRPPENIKAFVGKIVSNVVEVTNY